MHSMSLFAHIFHLKKETTHFLNFCDWRMDCACRRILDLMCYTLISDITFLYQLAMAHPPQCSTISSIKDHVLMVHTSVHKSHVQYSPGSLHCRVAGSGLHWVMLVHTALTPVLGNSPELQRNVMVAPSAALWKLSMNPLLGEVGCPHPAEMIR